MKIDVSDPEVIIPSPQLPPSTRPSRSNNNLDVCVVDGTTFLAWRTAPIHFAHPQARIEIVSFGGSRPQPPGLRREGSPSAAGTPTPPHRRLLHAQPTSEPDASPQAPAGPGSEDDGEWTHECTIAPDRDLREPRFVEHDGRLLMYYFPAGRHPAKFEPREIHVVERLGPQQWSDPEPVSPFDHIDWRIRSVNGQLVMSQYGDASGAYTTDRSPRAEFWRSADGRMWETMFDCDALEDGTTETDFVVLPDGNFLLVSRKENRGSGLGTVLAVIDQKGAVIESRFDSRKFDSPALFNWKGRTFIVTRRQVAFGGRVEVMPAQLPPGWRDIGNQILYWTTPKGTSLYEIDRTTLVPEHVTNLPGCGDTAFAAIVGAEDDETVTVYNYSSPFWMTYAPWVVGQLSPTQIHRVTLTMTE